MNSRLTQLQIFFILISLNPSAIGQSVLNYFKASIYKGHVLLEWQMIQGNTCDGISIYHASEGTAFNKIGEIGGTCGSKTETITYTFEHQNPFPNQYNYYKLEFGGIGPGPVIEISLIDYSAGFQIRPHPIQGAGRIYFPTDNPPYEFQSFSTNGVLLYSLKSSDPWFDLESAHAFESLQIFIIRNADGGLITKGRLVHLK